MDYLRKRAVEENIEDYLEKALEIFETTDVGQNDGLPNSKCDNNKSDPAR